MGLRKACTLEQALCQHCLAGRSLMHAIVTAAVRNAGSRPHLALFAIIGCKVVSRARPVPKRLPNGPPRLHAHPSSAGFLQQRLALPGLTQTQSCALMRHRGHATQRPAHRSTGKAMLQGDGAASRSHGLSCQCREICVMQRKGDAPAGHVGGRWCAQVSPRCARLPAHPHPHRPR